MSGTAPSAAEARALAAGHTLVPVHRELLADMLTPVRVYSLLCPPGEPGFLLEAVEARLAEMEARLHADPAPVPVRPHGNGAGWRSNVTRGQYESMVDAAREHILAGDAFQVVLSQRFSKPLNARPFDVYRCLRG